MRGFNFARLLKKMQTGSDQVAFLQEFGILPNSRKCTICDKLLNEIFVKKKKYYFFRCSDCDKQISIRTDTILSNANLLLSKFVLLVYIFVKNYWTYRQIQVFCILMSMIQFFLIKTTTQIISLSLNDRGNEFLPKVSIIISYGIYLDIL